MTIHVVVAALGLFHDKLYTAEQIRTLQEQAREAGAAEALGRLLGRQLVAAEDRTQAIELLFGPRGRRHQRVRPLVEAAAASLAPQLSRDIGRGHG